MSEKTKSHYHLRRGVTDFHLHAGPSGEGVKERGVRLKGVGDSLYRRCHSLKYLNEREKGSVRDLMEGRRKKMGQELSGHLWSDARGS